MNSSPLNSSSHPPEVSEGHPLLWDRLLPWALLALGVHAGLLLVPVSRQPASGPAGRIALPADDTPELLRLSRAATPLTTIPDLAIAGLPPPPPPSLLHGAAVLPATASRAPEHTGLPVPALPMPALPGSLEAATSAMGALVRLQPQAALLGPDRDGLVALQRRQWWLSAVQEPRLATLWKRAAVVEPRPAALGKLPEGVELRRLGDPSAAGLSPHDWHGHSLVGRQGVLLLWRQAGSLWLVKLPMPAEQVSGPDPKTITAP
jgi:hypothetical protein